MLIIKVIRKADNQCMAHTGVTLSNLTETVRELMVKFSIQDHKVVITEQ